MLSFEMFIITFANHIGLQYNTLCSKKTSILFLTWPLQLHIFLFPFILSNTHSSCNCLLYPCVDTACGQQKFICSQFICCNHAPGPPAQEFISEYVCANLCDQPPEQTHLACQKLISGHICPSSLKTVLAVSWQQKAQLLFGWSSLMELKFASSSHLKSKQTNKQTSKQTNRPSPCICSTN